MLLVDGGSSPSGTGWIYLSIATCTNYGISVYATRPNALQAMSRYGRPWASTIVGLVVECLFWCPSPAGTSWCPS
jgi:hypothetical protein